MSRVEISICYSEIPQTYLSFDHLTIYSIFWDKWIACFVRHTCKWGTTWPYTRIFKISLDKLLKIYLSYCHLNIKGPVNRALLKYCIHRVDCFWRIIYHLTDIVIILHKWLGNIILDWLRGETSGALIFAKHNMAYSLNTYKVNCKDLCSGIDNSRISPDSQNGLSDHEFTSFSLFFYLNLKHVSRFPVFLKESNRKISSWSYVDNKFIIVKSKIFL